MKDLQITDQEAQRLTLMMKRIIENHDIILAEGAIGEIFIVGSGNYEFKLNYRYTKRKKVFNFREAKYDYNLIRINLNDSFHKNADGQKIWGNRINIFSTQEYFQKADGTTYMRSFPLPFETIRNTEDFFEVLTDLLSYTNTDNVDNINMQDTLL